MLSLVAVWYSLVCLFIRSKVNELAIKSSIGLKYWSLSEVFGNKAASSIFLGKIGRQDVCCAFVVAAVAFFLNVLWFSFDHHIPIADEAGHILNSLAYRDLFQHCRPFKCEWWWNFLTVNEYYPPLVYAFSGLVKALVGSSRAIDVFVMSLFAFVLSASSFLCVRVMGFRILAACLLSGFLCLYPLAAKYSHSFMLEEPSLAMISLGIMCLCMWWQNPTLKSSVVFGCVLSLCCLTKQVVAAFLIGPGLFFFVLSCLDSRRKRLWVALLIILSSMILLALPWLAANSAAMLRMEDTFRSELMASGGGSSVYFKVWYYLGSLLWALSPPFFILFIASIFLLDREKHFRLGPYWASFTVGLLLLSANFRLPEERILFPALLLPAASSAILLAHILKGQRSKILKASVSILFFAGLFNHFLLFYCPYPVSCPSALSKVQEVLSPPRGLGETLKIHPTPNMVELNPVGFADWGFDWALSTITATDGNAPVYLNLLVNQPFLNAHTFELACKEARSNINPTTSRRYTCVGDEIDFSPETALYFDWYLLKSGDQGYRLKDEVAQRNLSSLEQFIRHGSNFRLVAKKRAPDGGELFLYRKRSH